MSEFAKSARWWDAEEGTVHAVLGGVVQHIHQRSAWRRQADELHAELYAGGAAAAGLRMSARNQYDYEPQNLPYNVCRSAVDTTVAKIAKHRPLPQALTTRGDWKKQKRAKKLSQFIEGQFYKSRLFERWTKLIVRDAAIFGRGLLKVFRDEEEICCERAHPWEVLVDDWDARYGEPRNLYHVRTIDKGTLLAKFGKRLTDDEPQETVDARIEAIEKAGLSGGYSDWDWQDESDSTVERVRLVEAWRLPTRDDMDDDECDGRYVMTLIGGSVDLVDVPWTRRAFPFCVLQFSDPVSGFWGQGLVEQAEGFQYEINDMSQKVSEAHWMLGGGMILSPLGSDILDTSLSNGNVPIVKHQPGKAPQFVTPTPIHPSCYQRLRDLPTDCLNTLGVSQMAAQGAKDAAEAGMSGVALQALDDQESERFVVFGRAYEAWCLDVARAMIAVAKEIAEEDGDYAVEVHMKGGLLPLSWSDVNIEGYDLRVFSTSILPSQPAARLDRLNTLFNAGVIDRATFLRYLDAPDLQAEMDMDTADRLLVDEILELLLDAEGSQAELDSVYITPSPYSTSLDWGMKRAQQKLARAQLDGAPDENQQLLIRYILDSQAMKAKAQAMNAPPPAPGGGPNLGATQPTAPPAPGPGQVPMGGAPAPMAA